MKTYGWNKIRSNLWCFFNELNLYFYSFVMFWYEIEGTKNTFWSLLFSNYKYCDLIRNIINYLKINHHINRTIEKDSFTWYDLAVYLTICLTWKVIKQRIQINRNQKLVTCISLQSNLQYHRFILCWVFCKWKEPIKEFKDDNMPAKYSFYLSAYSICAPEIMW